MSKLLKLLSLVLIALFTLSACATSNSTVQVTKQSPDTGNNQTAIKDSSESPAKITFYDSFATW